MNESFESTYIKGDWIQTYTGKQFWPMDPKPEHIDIQDIAHALSNLCRYNGHCQKFYSVAEHSVLVMKAVTRVNRSPGVRLCALLHDASEAYLADVPRPVKPFLTGYKEAELKVELAIAEHFHLPHANEFPVIKEMDTQILVDEVKALMPKQSVDWHRHLGEPLGYTIHGLTPEVARYEFLKEFEHLQRFFKR